MYAKAKFCTYRFKFKIFQSKQLKLRVSSLVIGLKVDLFNNAEVNNDFAITLFFLKKGKFLKKEEKKPC